MSISVFMSTAISIAVGDYECQYPRLRDQSVREQSLLYVSKKKTKSVSIQEYVIGACSRCVSMSRG